MRDLTLVEISDVAGGGIKGAFEIGKARAYFWKKYNESNPLNNQGSILEGALYSLFVAADIVKTASYGLTMSDAEAHDQAQLLINGANSLNKVM